MYIYICIYISIPASDPQQYMFPTGTSYCFPSQTIITPQEGVNKNTPEAKHFCDVLGLEACNVNVSASGVFFIVGFLGLKRGLDWSREGKTHAQNYSCDFLVVIWG